MNLNKKSQRVFDTLKEFLKHNGNISDVDLAKELNKNGVSTTSSTVGRDLSINLVECYLYINREKGIGNETDQVLLPEQIEVLKLVESKRKENKALGRSKGGKTSTSNNEYVRESDGKFKGIKK